LTQKHQKKKKKPRLKRPRPEKEKKTEDENCPKKTLKSLPAKKGGKGGSPRALGGFKKGERTDA